MTTVWRIGYCKNPAPLATELLLELPYGSTQANGRWHLKTGPQAVYAGSSRALCQLEKRVHSNTFKLKDQALMRLELPSEAKLLDVEELGLPVYWRHDEGATQAVGVQWLRSMASLGLWVPSAIEPDDKNLVINPAHPDYRNIALVVERNPFEFDARLFEPPAA